MSKISEISNGTSKVAYCKCGNKIITACVMPYAEIDKQIQKDFSRLAKENRKIEIITNEKFTEIGMCGEKNCENCEKNNFQVKQTSLFQ